MTKPESNTTKFVKRVLESRDEESDIDSRPHKRPKLNPAKGQTGTSALPNKNHLQHRRPNSANEQAGANNLPGKDQELRREGHCAKTVPKQDATQPSEQKPLQSDGSAKPGRKVTDTTRLNRAVSAIRQLRTANEDLMQKQEEMKQQQDDVIKKAVKDALAEKVVEAVEAAQVAIVEKVIKRVDDAATKKIAAMVEKSTAETDEKIERTANELRRLRNRLNESERCHKESKMHLESRERTLAQEHEAAVTQVKEGADQAEKVADKKLQRAIEEKTAAESSIVSMKKGFNRHSQQLVKRQQIRLEFIRLCHDAKKKRKRAQRELILSPDHCEGSVTTKPDSMDLEEVAYPSPQSEVAQQTPNGWSQPQNSTSRFASSTSSTTNDVSTHDFKPRQGLMWNSRRNATPFANLTLSKVSDPENIAMENHSRKGLSGEPPHSGESDEEYSTSNAPRSQVRQFQSLAQQATRSFGRPSVGHLAYLDDQQQQVFQYTPGPLNVPHAHHQRVANILIGAGQSNSRRASRNTAVQTNYSQQNGEHLNGADQSNSYRAAPPSRPQNAPTQWLQTPPVNNNTSDSYGKPRPTPQNTRSRAPRRMNRFDDAQYSDSGYAASQLRNPGSFAQARPAHLNGDALSPAFHRAPQSHYQNSQQYAPSGSLNSPAQPSSTYPASQLRYQDSFTQSAPTRRSGPAQETNFYAQPRLAADNQRNAAHKNLSSPFQGQPQQGQRGRGRGGRGGSRGRSGSRNGRGGIMNRLGGPKNDAINRNQPYDADDEHDPRPVMAATSQYGASGSPGEAQTVPRLSRREIREQNDILKAIARGG